MHLASIGAMHRDLPDFAMPEEEEAQLAAESFRLLADPTRIKILWALLQGESSVACLGELVGANPTVVSQHLAKLRLAGLVKGRREGTFVYYRAADVHVRRLLAEALFHAEHSDEGVADGEEHGHRHREPALPATLVGEGE
jgi:DNA-binding transcriptional ArsR family regulator